MGCIGIWKKWGSEILQKYDGCGDIRSMYGFYITKEELF